MYVEEVYIKVKNGKNIKTEFGSGKCHFISYKYGMRPSIYMTGTLVSIIDIGSNGQRKIISSWLVSGGLCNFVGREPSKDREFFSIDYANLNKL